MKDSKLLDAIGGIRPDYIASAEKKPAKVAKYSWKMLVPLAASLCLILVAALTLPNILGGQTATGSGGDHQLASDGSAIFMSYQGPVLPLMLSPGQDQADLMAHRHVTYDFYHLTQLPEGEQPNVSSVLIKDDYRLENSARARTIRLVYPFVSSVDELFLSAPRIMSRGQVIPSRLLYGDLTGSFTSADGSSAPGETLNIENTSDWQAYQALLASPDYFAKARTNQPDVKQTAVTVYQFKDSYYPENEPGLDNPSLVAGLAIDSQQTRVLSLGFTGRLSDQANNQEYYMYSMPEGRESAATDEHYLILIGQDSASLSIETQKSGGWEAYEDGNQAKRNDLSAAGTNVERREMTLDQALDLALPSLYRQYQTNIKAMVSDYKAMQPDDWQESDKTYLAYEDFKQLYIRDIFEFGVLSPQPMMRYADGALESYDVRQAKRVFWAAFELELAADQTLAVTMESYKKGSFDFYGKTHQARVYGYDLLTDLSLALALETTTAEIKDYGRVKILRQNFGFDLEQNIRSVELSRDIPHYYMEVQAK